MIDKLREWTLLKNKIFKYLHLLGSEDESIITYATLSLSSSLSSLVTSFCALDLTHPY